MLKLPRPFYLLSSAVGLLLLLAFYLNGHSTSGLSLRPASTKASLFGGSRSKSPLSPHVHTYFDQVFAVDTPTPYSFPAIKAACARTEWREENREVYLQCGGMSAGMTSILSQIKVCFKMAIDAGVNIVLPSMPLRDSGDLTNFNFMNDSAYMSYDQWFDSEHLTSSMARVCPQMKIRESKIKGTPALPVGREWDMDIAQAPGYQWLAGYFWVGRPFKTFFDDQLASMRFMHRDALKKAFGDLVDYNREDGATIVKIASQFLLYRITDDATGRDLALWNDISHLVRFKKAPREAIAKVLSYINGPFIGLHFRVEKDNIWSSFETQLEHDLDILDKIWLQSGTPNGDKPLIYIACGDESQIARFSEAARPRGWTVTSKYDLIKNDPEALTQVREMPFDFQGAIDFGVMLKSHFFIGIIGSAFSSTVGNSRDVTGRYRGSSVLFPHDENARTHLFNDGDAAAYPCCL